jgi:hypothetical protein
MRINKYCFLINKPDSKTLLGTENRELYRLHHDFGRSGPLTEHKHTCVTLAGYGVNTHVCHTRRVWHWSLLFVSASKCDRVCKLYFDSAKR